MQAQDSDGTVKAKLFGFDVEVRIKRGLFLDNEGEGFTLIVHKKTKQT